MKIDLHTHTRKTKSGDAKTRNIEAEDFCKIVTSTDVKIIAITNHNVFDKQQFDEICDLLDESTQVWPGVELDIVENGSRGHLLVIVSPDNAAEFSDIMASISAEFNPDSFQISIEKVVQCFDHLGPLYIAHYHQKKPDLSDEDLSLIIERTANKSRVIKEVSNAISAGIFIEHGHPSIYGSDIQDWAQYEEKSVELPEIRLPVESFEQFCLLLEKDPQTINTALDKKNTETLTLEPFEDDTQIELKFYNDINIFFGSKGTGKTKLLEAIESHYNNIGISTKVLISGSNKLEDQYDLKGSTLSANTELEPHGISFCGKEIESLKNAAEADVTSLDSYVKYFDTNISNKNAKKILLKNFALVNESVPNRKFESYYGSLKKLDEFIDFVSLDSSLKAVTSEDELNELNTTLKSMREKLSVKTSELFISFKEACLFNSAIEKVREEVARKAGAPAKPSNTGFATYAKNRIAIEVDARVILSNLNKKIKNGIEYVGFLGDDKGKLYCKTEIIFQTGNISDASFSTTSNIKKTPQKDFASIAVKILNASYEHDLFEYIADLNKIDQIEEITALHKLLLFRRFFTINNKPYEPSTGESSMLMLHEALDDDKEVYILDEPEKSLGNDYISDVIVPLINEKAKTGKRVFISTHDANIAVRTLPYNSIFRVHDDEGYKTYVGNPFSNNLVNIENDEDQIDWKEKSMKTLEGGKEAFGERGKIYGNL